MPDRRRCPSHPGNRSVFTRGLTEDAVSRTALAYPMHPNRVPGETQGMSRMPRQTIAELLGRIGGSGLAAIRRRVVAGSGRNRDAGGHTNLVASPDSSVLSVIDCGAGLIKAVVVEPEQRSGHLTTAGQVRVLGVGVAPMPGTTATEGDPGELLTSVERALREAEDLAGTIPRRAMLAVPSAQTVVALGEGTIIRPAPSAPITRDELAEAMSSARSAALAKALDYTREDRGGVTDLRVVSAALFSITVDAQSVTQAVGLTGAKVTVSLAVATTELAVFHNLRTLAERLDLELVGVVGVPAALGSAVRTNVPPSGAVVIDIGAGATTIARIGQAGTELSLSVPIGTNALEDHLVAETGMTASQSRETLNHYVSGDLSKISRRANRDHVQRVGAFFASVWRDAVEVRLADLAREHPLPPLVWLCGGGARLPDLRGVLTGPAWRSAYFDQTPVVSILGTTDLVELRGDPERMGRLHGSVLVPSLALGIAAIQAIAPTDDLSSLVSRLRSS